MKGLFKIHYSFYIIIFLLLLIGYINVVINFLIIIMVHELGHILMIRLLGYHIKRITIYATGGVIITNIDINIESFKLFLISISGILAQSLLWLLPLRLSMSNYFNIINLSIIVFNLLPIYPSDGYKILLSLVEDYISYPLLIKISFFISFIFLLILFIYTKNIIIFITLYILNVRYILEYRYYIEKFYLERYLYGVKYHKEKIIKRIEDIYKCRNNYIKCGNILKEEKDYYQEKYAYFIDIDGFF